VASYLSNLDFTSFAFEIIVFLSFSHFMLSYNSWNIENILTCDIAAFYYDYFVETCSGKDNLEGDEDWITQRNTVDEETESAKGKYFISAHFIFLKMP
jgi:hypothetical protein